MVVEGLEASHWIMDRKKREGDMIYFGLASTQIFLSLIHNGIYTFRSESRFYKIQLIWTKMGSSLYKIVPYHSITSKVRDATRNGETKKKRMVDYRDDYNAFHAVVHSLVLSYTMYSWLFRMVSTSTTQMKNYFHSYIYTLDDEYNQFKL